MTDPNGIPMTATELQRRNEETYREIGEREGPGWAEHGAILQPLIDVLHAELERMGLVPLTATEVLTRIEESDCMLGGGQ